MDPTAGHIAFSPEDVLLEPGELPWHPLTRVAFRFVFCYFTLFGLDMVGYVTSYVKFFAGSMSPEYPPFSAHLWGKLVPWLGIHVFHFAKAIDPLIVDTDGRYSWLIVLVDLALAVLATIAWTGFDRRRRNYRVLHGWLTVAIRMLLATNMLYYGVDKVFPLQFGNMTLDRLATPLGANTHFDALWNFMAISPGYTIFGGATELLGGLLLLLPELTPLGALVCVSVLSNVFALNMFYDVTVKVLSFHLLVFALFLLAPYASKLVSVLVQNRATAPAPPVQLATGTWVNSVARRWIPLALGLTTLCFMTIACAAKYKQREQRSAARSALYGVWEVDGFHLNVQAAQLLADKRRQDLHIQNGRDGWKEIIFQSQKAAALQLQDGVVDWVQMKEDPLTASLEFSDFDNAGWKCFFTTSRPSQDTLSLMGMINGSAVTMTLHRQPVSKLVKENGKFQFLDPDE